MKKSKVKNLINDIMTIFIISLFIVIMFLGFKEGNKEARQQSNEYYQEYLNNQSK